MQTVTKKPKLDVSSRWLIRWDMPAVQAIESHCFEFPWGEDDFIRCLRQISVIGIVAEVREQIVGFMVYELHKHRLHVLNFAVHEDWRFKGVGRHLVEKLKSKLSAGRRSRVMLEVRETNLDAQLFFKAMGFGCVGTMRDFYPDTPEDAYLFQYKFQPEWHE